MVAKALGLGAARVVTLPACFLAGGQFCSTAFSLGSFSLWDGLSGRGPCVLKSEMKLIIDRSDKEVAYFFGSIRARLRGEFDFA